MKKLVVNHEDGTYKTTYSLDEVKDINYGKMKDFFSHDDIYGNEHTPNEKCVYITFKNGTDASFGKGWFITFE